MRINKYARVSLAAGTSVLIGAAASVAGIAPAQATTSGPVGVPPCDDILGFMSGGAGGSGGLWEDYLDFSQPYFVSCVPQYGLGKVEFSVSSNSDIPADFSLEQGLPTQVSPGFDVVAAQNYFGSDLMGGAFQPGIVQGISRTDDGSDPRLASFTATVVLPLESVEVIDPSTLPLACTGTYTHAFTVTAGSGSTTLSGQTSTTAWSIPITVTPQPMTIALNLDATDPSSPTTNGDVCFAYNGEAQAFDGVFDPTEQALVGFLFLYLGLFGGLGDSVPVEFAGAFDTNSTFVLEQSPALANTGLDASQIAGVVGVTGAFIVLGATLMVIRRRRPSTSDE